MCEVTSYEIPSNRHEMENGFTLVPGECWWCLEGFSGWTGKRVTVNSDICHGRRIGKCIRAT